MLRNAYNVSLFGGKGPLVRVSPEPVLFMTSYDNDFLPFFVRSRKVNLKSEVTIGDFSNMDFEAHWGCTVNLKLVSGLIVP
jgi:hypothetical protein